MASTSARTVGVLVPTAAQPILARYLDPKPMQHPRHPLMDRGLTTLVVLIATMVVALWSGEATALAQGATGTSPQLYLLPQTAAGNNIALEAHVAELRLLDEAGGPRVALDATYRLRNPTTAAVTLPVRLFPGGDRGLGAPQGVVLSQGQQTLELASGDDGAYLSQVNIPASGTVSLRLRYQSPLGDQPLATLRYAPAILNQWAGNVSLRLEVRVPGAMPPESWVITEPDGWRHTTVTEAGVVGIHWLHDFTIPQTPFRIQFITPRTWSELQAAAALAQGDAPVPAFTRLGALYRELMAAASETAVRERFYAQAVAAYSAGLASRGVLLAPPAERATLHIGLADLYRRRILDVDPAFQPLYSEMMVSETAAALELLPEGDARRAELIQWRADGLQVLLSQARNRRDWPAALALVEALAALPGGPVAPELVNEQRRSILVQQALQLMEQGNRAAALAVIGDQIAADALTPPPQALSLFTGWQITVTATPERVHLVAIANTTPDRLDAARSALAEVVRTWEEGVAQSASAQGQRFAVVTPAPSDGPVAGQSVAVGLEMEFPAQATGILAARLLPLRPDYALLQTVLNQLAPTVVRRHGTFFEEITMRQPINLRPVVTEWQNVALGLEEDAARFELAGGAINAADVVAAEAALQARIQAATYRTAASEWRALVRQSRLLFTFGTEEPVFARLTGESPTRTWTVTAAAPPQTFVFQTQVLSLSRLLLAALAGFVVLLGVSGLLWSLL